MLYRFNSAAAGEIIMLAPHAEEIFAAIGRPLGERGVITADQLTAAIAALQQAMEHSKKQQDADDGASEDEDQDNHDDHDVPVPFHVRAWPFLNMLIKSEAAQKNVTWGF